MAVESDVEAMRVVIVGGGFGGASCAIACARQGMKVTLFDQASEFLPIGDSLGFGPNTVKIFRRWGLFDDLDKLACRATNVTIYNYDGQALAVDNDLEKSEQKYGDKSIIGHRGRLHAVIIDHCQRLGVDVRLGEHIKDYNCEKPSITLPNGQEVMADVVIASDGVKSFGREQILGYFDNPVHSGYACYRAFMKSDPFLEDEMTRKFVKDGDQINLWIGSDVHGFVTSLRDGREINAVLTHKDIGNVEEGWNNPGKRQDVLKWIQGWDPSLVRVWEKMENILDWKLVYRPCLDQWVTGTGLVAIMGDAAHPFLPTSTQGASQAIEDGATIAICLAKAGKGMVPLALNTYFEMRHDHVKSCQQSGVSQREKWHNMHDKESGELSTQLDLSNGLLDSQVFWKHDAEVHAYENWDRISAQVAQQMADGSYQNRRA